MVDLKIFSFSTHTKQRFRSLLTRNECNRPLNRDPITHHAHQKETNRRKMNRVMLTLCTNPQRSLRYKNYWYAKKYLLKCKWFPREITLKRNRKIVFRFSLVVNGKGLTHNYSRARVSWLRGVRYNRYSRAIVRFRLSTSRIRPNFPNDPALFIIIRRRITWQ